MKVAQLVGVRQMEVVELPPPQEVGPQDFLLRVKAVGVCGSDLHQFRAEPAGNDSYVYPIILGHEFAGQVEEVGSQVTNIRVRDRVAVDPAIPCGHCEFCLEGNPNICPSVRFSGLAGFDGCLQELLVRPAHTAVKLPGDMTYAQGAILEPLGVALHAVNLGGLRIADTVAVLGCGPIGLLIAQLARLSGAQDIFATDVLDHRLRMAQKQGVSLAINARRQDPVRAISEATQGRGVDVVFEVAGALETPEQSAEVCKPGGTVVVVGICGDDRTEFRAAVTRRRGLTIKISRRMKHVYARTVPLVQRAMVDIDTMVTHTFPLEQAPEAFRVLADYLDEVGKVVITST
jgi:L-iditol 2-dehydrogenase